MNRAGLSWALSAVLPHAGKPPRPSFVGIEHCGDWLYVYACDRYTLGIARVLYTDVPVANGYAHLVMSTKEATELERWVRPAKVADREALVAYTATRNELHVVSDDESAVFEASAPSGEFDALLDTVTKAQGKATEWQPVTVNPALLSRFTKAAKDGAAVRIHPKHGGQAGALMLTAGEDFIGLAMGIAYDYPTTGPDFTSWPFPERTAA